MLFVINSSGFTTFLKTHTPTYLLMTIMLVHLNVEGNLSDRQINYIFPFSGTLYLINYCMKPTGYK